MRNLSDEFIEQQNNGNHNYQKFVDITLKNGKVLHLTNKHLWSNGFSFEDSVSSQDNFDVGSAIINKFKIVLNNIYDEFSDYVFAGSTAVVYVGLQLSSGIEKIRICTGILSDEPKQRSSIITLQFLDNMSKFDKDYSEVKTIFPATRNQIIRDICSHCGVTLQTVTFDNDNYIIQKRPVDEALTCRQMLAWIAQIGGQWAKCDSYGRLCILWYNDDLDRNVNVRAIKDFSIDLEDVVITGVQVTEYKENSTQESPSKNYLYGKKGYVISISNNKLITEGTGQTIASMIGEKCVGMRFRPFEASCVTDISIESGDPVIIMDRKGNVFNSFITNVSLCPGDFQSLSCGAKSAERNSAKQYSLITQVEVEARKNVEREKTEREKALQNLADRISQSQGAFTTIQEDESGGKIFYLHNKPNLEDSDMVWKMTAEAWAVSTDGGKTWNGGMTVDGDTIVRILTATGVNADWINTGAITVRDSNKNIIFSVDMDTKRVIISGDSVQIGGQTASQALEENKEIANQALEEARKAHNLTISLTNDYQAIPADYNGNVITPFPTVKTGVTVLYGHRDVSKDCSYSVQKSASVTGSWDNVKREYTVTKLTADTGWVDITATYLGTLTITKRFNVSKNKGGVPGTNGGNGRNNATVYLYQRKASIPNKPTNALTYTFSTSTLSGTINNGWSTKIPSGTEPLYVTVATASSNTATASIPATAWASPVILAQNGETGDTGNSVSGVINFYKVSSKNTGELAPQSGGGMNLLLETQVGKSATGTGNANEATSAYNYSDYGKEILHNGTQKEITISFDWKTTDAVAGTISVQSCWSNWNTFGHTEITEKNQSGHVAVTSKIPETWNGSENVGMRFYLNGVKGTVHFSNLKLEIGNKATTWTPAPEDLGWSTTVPVLTPANKYLWNYEMINGSDESVISYTKPRVIGVYGDKGQPGINGLNVATVYLYQRKTSVPPKPTAAITYTFATGAVSGLTNGWLKEIPAGTAPLYVILATASSMEDTDSIEATEWSTPTIMTENGEPGRTYFLESSSELVKHTKNNIIIPSYVKFNAYHRDGASATRKAYAGRFRVRETADGKSWKTIYTSSKNESSIQHVLYDLIIDNSGNCIIDSEGSALGTPRDISQIEVTLYAADSTTKMLDIQTVVAVKDVDNITPEEMFNILTDNGEIKGIYKIDNQLYINANYIATGLLTDLKKNNYWNLETGDFRLSSDAKVGGKTVSEIAQEKVDNLTHDEIFNLLTKNGAIKGIYRENGQLYISFTYAKGGALKLGGINNGNGSLEVLDANGKKIGDWTKAGISLERGVIKGSSVILDNDYKNAFISGRNNGKEILAIDWSGLKVTSRWDGVSKGFCLSMLPFVFEGLSLKQAETGPGYGTFWQPNKFTISYNDKLENLEALPGLNPYSVEISSYKDRPDQTGIHIAGKSSLKEFTELKPTGIITTGQKNRCINTIDYGSRLQYCYETSSPMFGDIGEGTMDSSGTCYIYLDDVFTETISTGIEYQVFIQKEGQGDLWVDSKEAAFFIVKGTPNLKFSWEVKAKQRDYEYERLEDYNATNNKVDETDYESIGQKLFEEYISERENLYEESN